MSSDLAQLLVSLGTSGWGEFGALVVFMVTWSWLGRTISKSTHERELNMVQKLADERKSQADEWKRVADETNDQLKQLMPQLNVIAKFFSEVPVNGAVHEQWGDTIPTEQWAKVRDELSRKAR